MSDKIDDGGPAMPTGFTDARGFAQEGMSLRDYFAAAALRGLIANEGAGSFTAYDALSCYKIADAMLRARRPA